jgi:diguanylate cyclase (GGDEF)-like protein/PAS domain S-box-containing protein
MNDTVHDLREEYVSALQDYLAGEGESALERAYELGRRAVADGLGVLEIAAIHEQALGAVLFDKLKSAESKGMVRVAEFFAESLSPFEMVQRGLHEAYETLKHQNTELMRLLNVLDASLNEIYMFDAESLRFQYVNAHVLRNLGYSLDRVWTMTPLDLNPEFDEASFRSLIAPLLRRKEKKLILQTLHHRSDGSSYPVEMHLQLIERDQERIILSVTLDITERKQVQELNYLAHHDGLTALPNRLLFNDRLEHDILIGNRENKPLALLLMDLDRFKEINDTFGHHKGDSVLQQLAPRVRGLLRDSDTFARLGGDEFGILLPGASIEGAVLAAEKIAGALSQAFVVDGLSLEIGASIGIALFPEHGANADALMRHADAAMYAAKQSRLGHAVYAAEQDQNDPLRPALIDDLRRVADCDQWVLHYQPEVDLKSGLVTGAEALVRWRHPLEGLVFPNAFIPLAERSGLIKPVDRWVLDAALRQCRDWQRSGLAISVAVNLSARSLQDPKLPVHAARLLRRYDLRPGRLTLEIADSVMIAELNHAIDTLLQLSRMGVRISIDDFGAGYASLSHLRKLPIHQIKIDKTFVANITGDVDGAEVFRLVVELAQRLGLRVVAEGVESREVWDKLVAIGCDAAHGYYVCRPVPAEKFNGWLKESSWGLKKK